MHCRLTASIVALLGVEIAALIALHRLESYGATAVGWEDLSAWLAHTPPEDALVAVIRLAALALAWWLTASTGLYILASATRIPGLVHGVRWATLAPVRRMIDGAMATSILVGSTLVTPGAAVAAPVDRAAVVVQLEEQAEEPDESPQPAYQPRPAGDAVKVGYEPTPADDVPSTPPAQGRDPSSSSTQPPPPRSDYPPSPLLTSNYVVRPGDNLWTIAEQHLATTTGHPVHELDTEEVRSYWLHVVEANEDRVRSRQPDVIWPGEQLDLP